MAFQTHWLAWKYVTQKWLQYDHIPSPLQEQQVATNNAIINMHLIYKRTLLLRLFIFLGLTIRVD